MTSKPTDSLQEQGRTSQGRFAPGHVQNPKGRTPGSRNRATQAALALMEGQLEHITQTLIDAAVGGDMAAIKLVLDKLVPPCKERVLPEVSLPQVATAADLPALTEAILQAVAAGELTPSEANSLAALVSTHGKTLELHELEQRITALEQQGKGC